MDEAKLTDLVTTIADRMCGTHERLCVTLIRYLAAGQPVSAARLAADLAMDEPAVGAVLRQLSDVDYDTAGHVVGFGLSLVPTAHQFTINGRTFYTWCALDTFLYTALLAQPAQVVSHCPVTARTITLAMTPEGISELTPPSSVISILIPDGSVADCRRSAFCNHGHFLATAEAGARWLHDHPDGIILPIGVAHRLGRLLADRRMLLAGHEKAMHEGRAPSTLDPVQGGDYAGTRHCDPGGVQRRCRTTQASAPGRSRDGPYP
jgi:alkylmercury lyase